MFRLAEIREKNDMPSIGFVGMADYPIIKLVLLIFKQYLKNFQYIFQNNIFESGPIIPYFIHRNSSLNKIKNTRGIKSNFILRKTFAEGIRTIDSSARLTFINNIINNDYTFCMRGGGNYSLRLYETLCLGRIPLFINTNCVLPFEEKIDWKEICLWIDEDNLDRIGEIIIDFHSSITNNNFKERQVYAREVWEQYLSKEGFIKHFHDGIKRSLQSKV